MLVAMSIALRGGDAFLVNLPGQIEDMIINGRSMTEAREATSVVNCLYLKEAIGLSELSQMNLEGAGHFDSQRSYI